MKYQAYVFRLYLQERSMEDKYQLNTVDEIVDAYADLLFRIALQYTGIRQEAEDIVQETFLAMLKKLPFESMLHAKRWLIKVTINKCKDYFKSARRKNLPLDEKMNATYVENHEDLEELNRLDPLDRSIIYLFYYEGYSTKEIASMVGKTRNAVNIRLCRARETLKKLLQEGNDYEG